MMKQGDGDAAEMDLENLLSAIANPVRWRLLGLLADGRAWAVIDLGKRLGQSRSAVSKHVILLKKAGLVVQGPGRLYELAPGLKPGDGSRDIRLGHCTLHFASPDGGDRGGSPDGHGRQAKVTGRL